MLNTKEIITTLLDVNAAVSSALKKQGTRYLEIAQSLIESGDKMADVQEVMQTAKGSDWPRSDKDPAKFLGINEAAKGSDYADAYRRFQNWIAKNVEKDSEGRVAAGRDGKPIRRENGNNGQSKSEGETLTPAKKAAQVRSKAVKEIAKALAALRACEGNSKQAKANRTLAGKLAALLPDSDTTADNK